MFRAVDLGWPLAMPAITNAPAPEGAAPPPKRSGGNRGLRRRTAPPWHTLIQGALCPA